MKFALLKNVSFDPFADKLKDDPQFLFNDENYKEYLDSKIEYHEFEGTDNLIIKMSEVLSDSAVEVFNCAYDDKIIIQAFYYYSDGIGYEKIVFVKRDILKNDSYTYLDYINTNDVYIYHNIDMSDIIKIFKNKYVNKGLIVKSTDTIEEIEFIKITDSENIGQLIYNNDNIKFLNISNIINKASNDEESIKQDEIITNTINETIDNNLLDYVFTQKNIDFCILNYYSQIIGFKKNTIMSEIIRDDIYGDVIISIENTYDDDNRILNLTLPLFTKMYDCIKSKIFKRKNINYFNIYNEFM